MIEVKASELMKEQQKRFLRMKQKEQEKRVNEDARENFRRKPYMGMYRKQDQCGNDLGGRG